jgi:FH1/FH2 domain-containing protein 3
MSRNNNCATFAQVAFAFFLLQEDKDLVHEFVQNDGLACLIKVGSEVDQNYQNYILRALGQVMLYVDGMNGIMAHNETVQWLYSLISSKFRLVLKTALKLLLVFVEYKESNCSLLVSAIRAVDIPVGKSNCLIKFLIMHKFL